MKIDYLSRRENIILTTISLIHEMGISNVSLKNIAGSEGVSEAALYKHFRGKDDLLGAVMEYYEQYDNVIHNTIQKGEGNITYNIRRYFMIYAEYYSNYKEITSLVHAYDVLAYNKRFSQRALDFIDKKSVFLTEVVKMGQENGEVKKEVLAERLVDVLLGSFERVIAMWRLRNYSFSLRDRTQEIIGDILEAFREKDSRQRDTVSVEKKVKN